MMCMKRHAALDAGLHQLNNLTLRHHIQIFKETTSACRQLLLMNIALGLLNHHKLPFSNDLLSDLSTLNIGKTQ